MNQENNTPLEKRVGANLRHLEEEAIQTPAITAVDVVEAVRQHLIDTDAKEELTPLGSMVRSLAQVLSFYDREVKANAIAVDNLTEEKASDRGLQKVGAQYNMSMNQVVGYMDMCEQLNGQMSGTGIIAVPFWFHEQYVELQKMNEALIFQTDNLMKTLSEVEKKAKEERGTVAELGLDLPQRTNIITQTTTPYVAGETGPRLGDEYLDAEHVYVPPMRKR